MAESAITSSGRSYPFRKIIWRETGEVAGLLVAEFPHPRSPLSLWPFHGDLSALIQERLGDELQRWRGLPPGEELLSLLKRIDEVQVLDEQYSPPFGAVAAFRQWVEMVLLPGSGPAAVGDHASNKEPLT